MKKQNQLLFARNIFVFLIVISLAIIVATEKGKIVSIEKTEKEIQKYLTTNYPEIEKKVIIEKTNYQNKQYKTKITSKENTHLYFYIIKKKKEITDTYQKDYVEGNTLFRYLEKKIEKDITKKLHFSQTVVIESTLDQHISTIKEQIIKEENLLELKFYSIEKELLILNWNKEEIIDKITNLIKTYEENHITSKSYTITITNKNNIKEEIEIRNITSEFLENKKKEMIIEDILNNQNSERLRENKITYKYKNEEE